MAPSFVAVGERVALRPFRPADAADVFRYASDPRVARAAGWEPHRTPLDSLAYIERTMARAWGPLTLAVELLERARVVGVVDLRVEGRWQRSGVIGYSLAPAFWGCGLMVEAGALLLRYGFAERRLHRIRAVCDPANRRSFRTMEKLGMVREIERPSVLDRYGRRIERLAYAIERAEWLRRGGDAR